MNIMLGGTMATLPESLRGPFEDFTQKVNGNDGAEWEGAFKKFLRKEPCWVSDNGSKLSGSMEEKSEATPLPMRIEIDANLDPSTPSGLSITGKGAEHRRMGKVVLERREDGKLYINNVEATLYLSPNQLNIKTIQGNELRKEFERKAVLNACIFDALRANPQLIPDDWKQDEQGRTRYIFFWGTVFRYADGVLCVECLFWNDGQWDWYYSYWLDDAFDGQYPAASLAN